MTICIILLLTNVALPSKPTTRRSIPQSFSPVAFHTPVPVCGEQDDNAEFKFQMQHSEVKEIEKAS